MKILGLKEVKKGAKLLLKKEKIDIQLKELAKEYHNQVSVEYKDERYFLVLAEDYNEQKKSK